MRVSTDRRVHVNCCDDVTMVQMRTHERSDWMMCGRTGSVLIDGQDVLRVTGESVREHVAVVLQDGALFDDSLMYNIQYGKEGCTEQVRHLKCHHADHIILKTTQSTLYSRPVAHHHIE